MRTEPGASSMRSWRRRAPAIAARLGPGIVSGASDNDPTTVATLAVVGASTAFGLTWLVALVIPMLAVVQAIASRVGAVSRTGLEDAVRGSYGKVAAYIVLTAVMLVNLLTLAADLEGGAAALQLMFQADYRWFIVPFSAVVGAMLIWARYDAISRVLKIIPLVFLAYIVAAVMAHPNWGQVLRASVVPHFGFTHDEVAGAIALLGTTLTSYAYVWETVEVAKERPPLRRLGLVQADAVVGVVAAGIVFWFIVVTTGATLGEHHRQVQTAQDAAQALAPLAGRSASLLFGIGLLGSALLAVPVIAGTSAYVMAETFGWRRSLDATFARAPQFYLALTISLVVATAIALAGVSPIALLFASSIAGGLATPLTLAYLMLLASRRDVMRRYEIGLGLKAAGWAVTAVVTACALVFLWQTLTGQS